jgi:hypothetical protein
MPITTTNLNVTTTPTALISTATTWANSKGASPYDPISFALTNSGATIVRVGGAGLSTVAGAGVPVTTNGGTFSYDVKSPGEVLFIVTSASTSNVDLMADRQ